MRDPRSWDANYFTMVQSLCFHLSIQYDWSIIDNLALAITTGTLTIDAINHRPPWFSMPSLLSSTIEHCSSSMIRPRPLSNIISHHHHHGPSTTIIHHYPIHHESLSIMNHQWTIYSASPIITNHSSSTIKQPPASTVIISHHHHQSLPPLLRPLKTPPPLLRPGNFTARISACDWSGAHNWEGLF